MQIRCLLLVDSDRVELKNTEEKLAATHLNVSEVVVATSLGQAIKEIVSREIDIVLLDLNLSDSQSLDTLMAVRAVTDAVLIVLSVTDDEILACESLKNGADDFLVKSAMTEQSLRNVILRSINLRQIRKMSSRIGCKLDKLNEICEVR